MRTFKKLNQQKRRRTVAHKQLTYTTYQQLYITKIRPHLIRSHVYHSIRSYRQLSPKHVPLSSDKNHGKSLALALTFPSISAETSFNQYCVLTSYVLQLSKAKSTTYNYIQLQPPCLYIQLYRFPALLANTCHI